MPPFVVKDCALAAIATGQRAEDIEQLADILEEIDAQSIYYHFWGGMLRPRFDDPEYHNDFAVWINRAMHDPVLAERLGIIDPTHYSDLEELRQKLVEVIRNRLEQVEELPLKPTYAPFHFVRSQILIFETGRQVQSAQELRDLIPNLSSGSIFYHFIDARRRPPERIDDFSTWLEESFADMEDLCIDIRKLDPFFWGLNSLRSQLADILCHHLGVEA